MPKSTFKKSKTHRFTAMPNETHTQSNIMQTQTNIPVTIHPNTNPQGAQAQTQTITTSPEFEQYIHSIVQQALKDNKPLTWTDEVITDRNNLDDIDKTPDMVRFLRDFSGDPAEYTSWRKSVERVLEVYGHLRGTAKFYGIISVIRGKIIGPANMALESHNTPLNWDAIKHYLNAHYADKRDMGTLEYQLTTMVQGNSSIDKFYQRVYAHLSLIINNISCMGLDKNTEIEFIDSYRNKALDTFVRGLNGDLPRLLAMKGPVDLPEALHLCTKLANQDFRTSHANQRRYENSLPPPNLPKRSINNQRQFNLQYTQPNNNTRTYPNNSSQYPKPRPPIAQPQYISRNNQYHQQNFNPQPPLFYQQRPPQFSNKNYFEQTQQTQNYNQQFQNPPPRPIVPKPLPAPEPMDIDHSIRSQAVNYANRPKMQGSYPYRAPNNHITYPSQNQQNFHINTSNAMPEFDNYNNNPYEPVEQTLSDYVHEYSEQDNKIQHYENTVDISDVNFLD